MRRSEGAQENVAQLGSDRMISQRVAADLDHFARVAPGWARKRGRPGSIAHPLNIPSLKLVRRARPSRRPDEVSRPDTSTKMFGRSRPASPSTSPAAKPCRRLPCRLERILLSAVKAGMLSASWGADLASHRR